MTNIVVPRDSFPIPSAKLAEYRQILHEMVQDRRNYAIEDMSDAYERYAIALFYHGSYRESLIYFNTAASLKKSVLVSRSDAFAANLVRIMKFIEVKCLARE